MAAHVEQKFKRGFLLDEEKLRKLVNIINTRLCNSNPPIEHKFKVYRSDAYSYDTNRIDDVINEDNSDWRKMTKLQLLASQGEDFKFELTFDSDGTILTINGTNRDNIFLLFSDLREYLNNEVNACVHVSQFALRMIGSFVPLLLIMLSMGTALFKMSTSHPSDVDLQNALSSNAIADKLNFLVRSQSSLNFGGKYLFPAFVASTLIMILFTTNLIERFVYYLFPSNIFLFGPQKQKYDKRRKLLTNILWGILIASAISIISGLIVWKMTT